LNDINAISYSQVRVFKNKMIDLFYRFGVLQTRYRKCCSYER
jgi:hypothetical protein